MLASAREDVLIAALATSPVARTHIRRTGTLHVAAPVARAFEFFTPLGEKAWAEGWNPEFHHPPDGSATTGAVFTTLGAEGSSTVWVVVDWHPERHHVRYARITAGQRAGTVEVSCAAEGPSSTAVQVTYELTALSESGDAELATWTDEWYRNFLADWERAVASVLAPAQAVNRGDSCEH